MWDKDSYSILEIFKDYHCLNGKEIHETEAVNREPITSQTSVRKCVADLTAISLETKRQVTAAACSSLKASKAPPLTMPKEEDVLETAVPGAHMNLIENVRTAFSARSVAMKTICNIEVKAFQRMTESHEMETSDSLFGNVDLVLTDSSYNVLSEAVKVNSEHYVFIQENIINLFKFVRP